MDADDLVLEGYRIGVLFKALIFYILSELSGMKLSISVRPARKVPAATKKSSERLITANLRNQLPRVVVDEM
jgi:hypothetical protein